MPKSNALRKDTPPNLEVRPPAPTAATEQAHEIERLIHEPVRLAIVSALVANESLSFSDLKKLLSITDGNLAVHARKLEDAAYVSCTKGFVGRKPQTLYKLTAKGRAAFEKYVDHMESIVSAMRTSIDKS
jgi:DNA-binding MarR family transcriptional regulator